MNWLLVQKYSPLVDRLVSSEESALPRCAHQIAADPGSPKEAVASFQMVQMMYRAVGLLSGLSDNIQHRSE